MREQEALIRLQAHRDQCKDGCPKVNEKNASVEKLCPVGLERLLDYLRSEDDG